ncbi:copper homeostasis protein CutC [Crocinitomicaceae bacterium]|nr:copper homeostasis protein CutC [Crocinitomicaceae bacterium]
MKVELCAASIESIQLAKKYGIDRIELCQNLEQGGVTPSIGFIEYALKSGVETHVLIRPRPGGFQYTNEEVGIVLRNIQECKMIGVHGVVVGVLSHDGLINEDVLGLMRDLAKDMELTFHRAFDDTFAYDASLDSLIHFGVDRVLSSGLANNVDSGMLTLSKMKSYAKGRIEIMPGGGVNLSNISEILKQVSPDAIHFSGTQPELLDPISKFSEHVLKVNEERVIRLLNELR